MEIFFLILEYSGIIAFAVSGAMIAIDKEADLVGVIILAIVTAFGGGIMRDLFLGYTPPRFFTEYHIELAVAVASALAVFVFASVLGRVYVSKEKKISFVDNIFDAVGLGVFSVYSVNIAIEAGYDTPLVAISMGVVASVGGGLIRDLILGDIPFIIKKHIYVLASLAGAGSFYILYRVLGQNVMLASGVGIFVTFALRMLATAFRWNLPRAITFSGLSAEDKTEDKDEQPLETR